MATHFHNIRKNEKQMKEILEANEGKYFVREDGAIASSNDLPQKSDSEDDEVPSVHADKVKEESSSKSDNEEEKDDGSEDEASDSSSDQTSTLGKRSRAMSFSS